MAATESPERTTTATRPADTARADSHAVSAPTTTHGSGRATASLILGILSIPGALIPILGIALGVIGLVLGVTARNDMRRAGGPVSSKATVGIVLCCVGLGLALIVWIASAAVIMSNNN